MNPYEAPQSVNRTRRWFWVTLILILWCCSAAIGGFLLGAGIYFAIELLTDRGMRIFPEVLQSPWWQFAAVVATLAAAAVLPWGLFRTRKLNARLNEVYQRRAELISNINSRSGRA